MSAPDNVWAIMGYPVGADLGGHLMIRWDGTAWSEVPHPADYVTSIAMVSTSEGWAVGGNGTIMYWDGTAWTMQSSPTTETLWSVTLSTPTSGWAVGDGGTILHYAGPVVYLPLMIK